MTSETLSSEGTRMPAPGETEAALVAQWRAGEFAGRWLRAVSGEQLLVVFPGRPGGSAGPDFRDAVLARPDGSRLYGDVELHLRAGGWHAHGHHRNPCYSSVVLHVVRRAEGAHVTPLASGCCAPIVEVGPASVTAGRPAAVPPWPCIALARRLSPAAMRALLHAAGDARFDAHALAFATRLSAAETLSTERQPKPPHANVEAYPAKPPVAPERITPSSVRWAPMDRVLCAALAEGLAYGRERETLCRAGAWLAAGGAPDALTRELPRLPAHDATRLEGLLALHTRWEAAGPWALVRAALVDGTAALAARRVLTALTVRGGSVSPGRAAILAANIVLPAAVAWAFRHDNVEVVARSRAIYAALPGLPSNQITREMARQLGLSRLPAGARAQQGLQHLWALYCREKRCARCPCAAVG